LEMMQNAVQVVHVNVDPKQMDSFNCGPFLIFCVRHFMENTELYPFTVLYALVLTIYRVLIILSAFLGQLRWRGSCKAARSKHF